MERGTALRRSLLALSSLPRLAGSIQPLARATQTQLSRVYSLFCLSILSFSQRYPMKQEDSKFSRGAERSCRVCGRSGLVRMPLLKGKYSRYNRPEPSLIDEFTKLGQMVAVRFDNKIDSPGQTALIRWLNVFTLSPCYDPPQERERRAQVEEGWSDSRERHEDGSRGHS